MTDNFIRIRNVKKIYRNTHRQSICALNNLSLDIVSNQFLGLIGLTGSGKTTLARVITGLEVADSGSILYKDVEIINTPPRRRGALCRDIQMIFQDPYTSLSNRMSVYNLVAEPLKIQKIRGSNHDRIMDTLSKVGLSERFLDRYPPELSGGERQRVAIARALILKPSFIIADEIISMLDSSRKLEILDLLLQLKNEINLSVLFITHDILAAGYVCDILAVIDGGNIVEIGTRNQILNHPLHPRTQALIEAVFTI